VNSTKRIAFLIIIEYLIRAVMRAHLKLRNAEEPGGSNFWEGPRALDKLPRVAAQSNGPVTGIGDVAQARVPRQTGWKEHEGSWFPLETEHLIIRPFVPEDAPEIHEVYADLKLTHRISGKLSESPEDTHRLVARVTEHQREHGFSVWAMIEKESGRIIGDCGLFLVQGCWPEVEFTYHLGRPYWCKGYAKEATVACLRFGFEQLNFGRIIAVLNPDDPVSARMLGVVEKAGMSYMGTGWFHDQEKFIYATSRQRLAQS
jgi:RimJ/RimL family protein N-acetyltransferase